MKTHIVLAGILLFSSHPLFAQTTELEKLAAGLKPGEWGKLETRDYNRELIRVGGHHIYQYTHDGQWDPVRDEFVFLGQGHYSDLKMIVYSAKENGWSALPTPSWWKVDPEKGRGPIGHAYDNNALDPAGRIFYHQQYNSPDVHRFDLDERRWIESLTVDTSDGFQKGGHSSALSFFPEIGSLVRAHRNGHVVQYRVKDGQWEHASRQDLPLNKLHPFSQYIPVHKCVLFGGGNGVGNIYRFNADGKISEVAAPPFESLDSTHRYVITVDPVSGEMLVIVNVPDTDHSGKLFALDLKENAWRQAAATVPCSGSMIAAPLTDHGVVMVCSYRPEEVWLYRHSKP